MIAETLEAVHIPEGVLVVPWQLAAVVVGGGIVIIVALIMQLRDKADRETQRAGQITQAFRQMYADGLRWAREDYKSSRPGGKHEQSQQGSSGK